MLIIDNINEDRIVIKDSLNQAGLDCEYIEAEMGEGGLVKIQDDVSPAFPRIT